MTSSFGEFVKAKRIASKVTLRAFAREHGYDVGYLSKLEHGVIHPPSARDLQHRLAQALGLVEESEDWFEFFNLIAASSVTPPPGISPEELAAKLPVFFRTLQGQRVSQEKLEEFVTQLRAQYSASPSDPA